MPAAIALGTSTFTMSALPGTPAIQNAIPMPFFGTTPFAAPGLGVIASAIMLGFGLWWLGRAEAAARAKPAKAMAGRCRRPGSMSRTRRDHSRARHDGARIRSRPRSATDTISDADAAHRAGRVAAGRCGGRQSADVAGRAAASRCSPILAEERWGATSLVRRRRRVVGRGGAGSRDRGAGRVNWRRLPALAREHGCRRQRVRAAGR